MRKRYAPKVWQGEVLTPEDAVELQAKGCCIESADARTAAELLGTGLHVGFVDGPGARRGQGETGEAADEVDKEVFCKWIALSEPPLGNALGRWWAHLAPGADGDEDAFKARGDDVPADFFEKVAGECRDLKLLGEKEAWPEDDLGLGLGCG